MMKRGMRPSPRLGILFGLVLCGLAYAGTASQTNLLFTAGLLIIFCAELLRKEGERGMEPMAVTLFGVLYVGWLSVHLVFLRELPKSLGQPYAAGASYVLLAFWVTWICDTAAYGVGLWLGRNRLLPDVSPKKSVEGAIAGLLGSVLAAHVARLWFAPYLNPFHATVLGLAMGAHRDRPRLHGDDRHERARGPAPALRAFRGRHAGRGHAGPRAGRAGGGIPAQPRGRGDGRGAGRAVAPHRPAARGHRRRPGRARRCGRARRRRRDARGERRRRSPRHARRRGRGAHHRARQQGEPRPRGRAR